MEKFNEQSYNHPFVRGIQGAPGFGFSLTADGNYDMIGKKLTNVGENGPFVSFCLFWPGFGLSGLVMAFRACVWPF